MNSFYVMQHSYSEETYVNNFIRSDLVISAPAVQDSNGISGGQTGIGTTMRDEIAALPGVSQISDVFYTERTERLNPNVLSRLTAYYDDKSGGQSYWVQNDEHAAMQYSALKQTGETMVSIYGLDVSSEQIGDVYLGDYDEDLFRTGNYVVGFGLANNGEGSVHYEVGEEIMIDGRAYELMAMIEPIETIKGNARSTKNALGIDYAISEEAFRRSFPDVPALSLLIDMGGAEPVDVGGRINGGPEDAAALAGILQQSWPGFDIATKQDFEAGFQAQVLAQVIMGYTLGIIMAVIGILNFVNLMLTSIITRKREFAVLECVGMTIKQLKKMLMFEGLDYAVISVFVSLVLATFAAATAIQETVSTSWAANYNFSLFPFLIMAPVLITAAILIPRVCFKSAQRKSLTLRLQETAC